MCKQHFAHFGIEHLFLALDGRIRRQAHVFERQAHQIGRPAFARLNGHQRCARRFNRMSRCLRKAIAVASRAGGGIAHATGCNDDRVRRNAFARLQLYAGNAAVLNQQRFCAGIQPNVHIPLLHRPLERENDIAGMIGYGKYAIAALGLERHALAFDQPHQALVVQLRQRRIQKPRIAEYMAQKLLALGRIGHIAAALAGDVHLFAELFILLEQNDLRSGARGINRGHHSRGAAADHDDSVLHAILPSWRGKRRIYPRFAPCFRNIRKPRGGGAGRAPRSAR